MPDTLLRWIVYGTFTNDSRTYHTHKYCGFQDRKVPDGLVPPIIDHNWNSKPVSLDFSPQKTGDVFFLPSFVNPGLLQIPIYSTHVATTHSFELITHNSAGVDNRIDTRITFSQSSS